MIILISATNAVFSEWMFNLRNWSYYDNKVFGMHGHKTCSRQL